VVEITICRVWAEEPDPAAWLLLFRYADDQYTLSILVRPQIYSGGEFAVCTNEGEANGRYALVESFTHDSSGKDEEQIPWPELRTTQSTNTQ